MSIRSGQITCWTVVTLWCPCFCQKEQLLLFWKYVIYLSICLHSSGLLMQFLLFLWFLLKLTSNLEMHCLYSYHCLRWDIYIRDLHSYFSIIFIFCPSLKQLRTSKLEKKAQDSGFRMGSRVAHGLHQVFWTIMEKEDVLPVLNWQNKFSV